jgi:hypothetical protein
MTNNSFAPIIPTATMTIDSAARRLQELHPASFTLESATSRIRATARDLRIPIYLLGNGMNLDRAEAFELIDTISELTAE